MTVSPSDPRVEAQIRELRRAAIEADFEDHLWGMVVVAAQALVGLEDEAAAGRHPKGKAGGGAGV